MTLEPTWPLRGTVRYSLVCYITAFNFVSIVTIFLKPWGQIAIARRYIMYIDKERGVTINIEK